MEKVYTLKEYKNNTVPYVIDDVRLKLNFEVHAIEIEGMIFSKTPSDLFPK